MTQALLNNLSPQADLSVKTTSPKENVEPNDFQKLFEKGVNEGVNIENGTLGSIKSRPTLETTENTEQSINVFDSLKALCAYLNKTEEQEVEDYRVSLEEDDVIPHSEENEEEKTVKNPLYQNILNNVLGGLAHTQISNNESEQKPEETEETTEVTVDTPSIDTDCLLETVESNIEIKPKEVTVKAEEKSLEEIVNEEMLEELNIESVESETAEQDGSDLMQNQSPQEQGIKAMIQSNAPEFNEIKPQETQPAIKSGSPQLESNPSKIIEQVSKQMEGMKSGSRVSMILNPESLGKVEIQLINTKEGLSAQFTVATQDARNILLKGLDGLKETLATHGVSVDNVSVKLNESQESEYNSDWTEQENSDGGHREQNSGQEKRNKDEFEQTMSNLKEENGKV